MENGATMAAAAGQIHPFRPMATRWRPEGADWRSFPDIC
ncbi:hypothetical protein [Azospirillum palustre]